MMNGSRQTLLAAGPDGSRKTDVEHEIALNGGRNRVGGRVRRVPGLDVGTAKPAGAPRAGAGIPMVDVPRRRSRSPPGASPPRRGSAWAKFRAWTAADRFRRKRVLRVRALGWPTPGPVRDVSAPRGPLEWAAACGADRAIASCLRTGIGVADSGKNLKYTLRAMEIVFLTGAPASSRVPSSDSWSPAFRVVKLGLRPSAAQLHVRIEDRVRRMMDSGWGEEVRRLLDRGLSADSNSFQAIGYRRCAEWILGRSRDGGGGAIVAGDPGSGQAPEDVARPRARIRWVARRRPSRGHSSCWTGRRTGRGDEQGSINVQDSFFTLAQGQRPRHRAADFRRERMGRLRRSTVRPRARSRRPRGDDLQARHRVDPAGDSAFERMI